MALILFAAGHPDSVGFVVRAVAMLVIVAAIRLRVAMAAGLAWRWCALAARHTYTISVVFVAVPRMVVIVVAHGFSLCQRRFNRHGWLSSASRTGSRQSWLPLIRTVDALPFSLSGCSLPDASFFSSPHKVNPLGNFRG
jgi:hypothetical protein